VHQKLIFNFIIYYLTAGYSNGLRSRLRNQRSWVQIPVQNTADVINGKPIAVWSQSISSESAVYPLDAFYGIHGRKGEVIFFYLLSGHHRDRDFLLLLFGIQLRCINQYLTHMCLSSHKSIVINHTSICSVYFWTLLCIHGTFMLPQWRHKTANASVFLFIY
jgi:hypothetical protein